jgi:hypothetical protein
LPQEYKNVLLFNILTGLGPDEAQKAIHLIKTREIEYVYKARGALNITYFLTNSIGRQKMHTLMLSTRRFRIGKKYAKQENYYNSSRKRISITNDFDMNMFSQIRKLEVLRRFVQGFRTRNLD